MSNEAPRLVVAIDIGTVQSAVNIFYRSTRRTLYLVSVGDCWRLIRRCIPSDAEGTRLPVDQWPGQEKLRWSQCVPSVLLYDDSGQAGAV